MMSVAILPMLIMMMKKKRRKKQRRKKQSMETVSETAGKILFQVIFNES